LLDDLDGVELVGGKPPRPARWRSAHDGWRLGPSSSRLRRPIL
jgi:hypothetical protein